MWAAGVSRSDTEVLYRTADARKIELTLRDIERDGVHGRAAFERLVRDSNVYAR